MRILRGRTDVPRRASESEGRPEVTLNDPHASQSAEVTRLATAVADLILQQRAAGTSIPLEHFRLLVSAARMLHENDAPWPPSVDYILREVARYLEQAEIEPDNSFNTSESERVVESLSRSLEIFWRKKNSTSSL